MMMMMMMIRLIMMTIIIILLLVREFGVNHFSVISKKTRKKTKKFDRSRPYS
jgi:hypothetical protein